MKTVFVSGARQGQRSHEFAVNAGKYIAKMGGIPVVPQMMFDDFEGLDESFASMAMLSKCEGVFMLANWKDEDLPSAELQLAKDNDIPTFFNLNDLRGWL